MKSREISDNFIRRSGLWRFVFSLSLSLYVTLYLFWNEIRHLIWRLQQVHMYVSSFFSVGTTAECIPTTCSWEKKKFAGGSRDKGWKYVKSSSNGSTAGLPALKLYYTSLAGCAGTSLFSVGVCDLALCREDQITLFPCDMYISTIFVIDTIPVHATDTYICMYGAVRRLYLYDNGINKYWMRF